MKYLPLRDFDVITTALNFSTSDCHVIGGCDVYTTKAAGSDKKLYKSIDHSLESQYETLVRLSASLSPPYRSQASDDDHNKSDHEVQIIGEKTTHKAVKPMQARKKRAHTAELPEIDLSRKSPFGPLSQINARRTFAYLIATLNASHPDYDFSHILRPSDFRKQRSLRTIMQTIDSTLQNLRPKQSSFGGGWLAPPTFTPTGKAGSKSGPTTRSSTAARSAAAAPNYIGTEVWSPRMWNLIDKEMGLRQCEKFSYQPDDDPFDGDEGGGAIWSLHYLFFNKERKRVCYLFLRGLSVISHSPVFAPMGLPYDMPVRKTAMRRQGSEYSVGEGAVKRASYWLGDRYDDDDIDTQSYGPDDDDEDMILGEDDPMDDEVEVPRMDLDEIREMYVDGYASFPYGGAGEDGLVDDAYDYGSGGWIAETDVSQNQEKAEQPPIRCVSEDVVERMEM